MNQHITPEDKEDMSTPAAWYCYFPLGSVPGIENVSVGYGYNLYNWTVGLQLVSIPYLGLRAAHLHLGPIRFGVSAYYEPWEVK